MMRATLLLAGFSVLAFAAPATAQSLQGMDHGSMPGMHKTPAPKPAPVKPAPAKKKPPAKPAPAPAKAKPPVKPVPAAIPSKAPAKPGHSGHGAVAPAPAPSMANPPCSPEHAAMGHCTPSVDGDAAAPMLAPIPNEPDCPPAHAAMGHCTPKVAPLALAPKGMSGPTGTDLPAGDGAAPAPPTDWYADRLFPKDEMDRARHAMMVENGGQTTAFISFNLAEYQARKGHDGYRWDGEAWYGGDINRLTVKNEGEGVFGEGIENVETQLLYSRAVGPYFNAQAGIRQDFGPGPDRTYATVGFEGLAPYWFEVEGALFLSNKGDLLARLEGYYDQRITQKLILQPMAEFNLAAQDVPETGIGSGLSNMEIGLRLRYEVVKEFAPYFGVEWARKFGDTARFARAVGDDANSVSLVVGLKTWF